MLRSIVFIFVLCLGTFASAAPACRPFRPDLETKLPPPPEIRTPNLLPSGWEKALLLSIDLAETDDFFSKIYLEDKATSPDMLSDRERFQWLSCLSYYFTWQRTHSSTHSWTAIVDNRPSRILYPIDVDKEFGIDPIAQVEGMIPSHFEFAKTRAEESRLQKKLFQKYGILAVDHTDRHSATVLKEFIFLLDHSLGKKLVRELPSLHYLYAFAGHDIQGEIAAYHHQMKAISVGGVSSYPSGAMKAQQRFTLIAALAHEIGHAFLFDHIGPVELRTIATEYGNWQISHADGAPSSLYSPIFFQEYSQQSLLKNLPTQYAATNIHEWFAESFAAKILIDLVESGSLGKDAGRWLNKYVSQQSHWTNYKNLGSPFNHWLTKKMADVRSLN